MSLSDETSPEGAIRPVAIALVRRGNELLASAVRNEQGTVVGWRPPGGLILFGEPGPDAIKRSLWQDLQLEIEPRAMRAVLENFYQRDGALGHEIVLVYDADFKDKRLYSLEAYAGEPHAGLQCRWAPVADFTSGREMLFPRGLAERLD